MLGLTHGCSGKQPLRFMKEPQLPLKMSVSFKTQTGTACPPQPEAQDQVPLTLA